MELLVYAITPNHPLKLYVN